MQEITQHEIAMIITTILTCGLILWGAFSTANIKPNKPEN